MILRRDRRSDVDVASCLANLDRLEALDRTGAMDAPRRDDLDELTRRAADRLSAPMAFLSLLDDRRQFFASDFGASAEIVEARQTDAGASYCQYVVAFEDALVISDATSDPLVRDHPATRDGTRAYLGVPITVGGQPLGRRPGDPRRARTPGDSLPDGLT